jgi:hypothetical protein
MQIHITPILTIGYKYLRTMISEVERALGNIPEKVYAGRCEALFAQNFRRFAGTSRLIRHLNSLNRLISLRM